MTTGNDDGKVITDMPTKSTDNTENTENTANTGTTKTTESTKSTEITESTEDVPSANASTTLVAGSKRIAADDIADSARRASKRVKRHETWGDAFRPIVDSVPSEDAPIPVVRRWFRQIGCLHGLGRADLLELRWMCLLGHNLRQAGYSDLKEYLMSIAQEDGHLRMHASVIAADAYEAVCLKKVMETEGTETNRTKATQISLSVPVNA
ncbi:uncharacterized protein F4807DRAFT_426273 [Annulohypoxylon truncatum]|uniref:uncharacterized protein n=1 Tax=Annulohypoxylon truncatum TaxID=327061 RepID=UPI002007F9E1|nr:uncharacterized protein F4807DRAFT_426273 [Annulohypoxylon truncatum]KAI1209779.1 hypothetical protein F4807DRAFT_426273 [Annulohypoxylon truncatum]